MAATESRPVDHARLERTFHQMVGEAGAALNTALIAIGDRLGLYRAMRDAGPLTPAELAERTGTLERYVREWLCAQAAGGLVDYDAASGCFELSPEQALILADEGSPVNVLGLFQIVRSTIADEPRISDAFQSHAGVGWHEHSHDLFEGTERFFRVGYHANLVASWIPALDGVEAKLTAGAHVADVGCGHGASTILMAQAYPASTFVGSDYHAASIAVAREHAAAAGVADRCTFEVAPASGFPGTGYDLVTMFDCLHDLGDPVGAARRVREALAPDGTWLIVEPYANDRIEDNLNPIGRIFYSASTLICTPASLSQEVGLGLGAQAGEARLRDVATAGGFTRFRRATETPVNLVLEARP